MPKIVAVPGGTPVTVELATKAFASPVRLHLIRHYLQAPGTQADACRALGLSHRVVNTNTRALVTVAVLVEEPGEDGRSSRYRVDLDRFKELLDAIDRFARLPDHGLALPEVE